MIWLLWAGSFVLMILFGFMSQFSRTEGKKILYAILAVACIIPFPIHAHGTFYFPAWLIPLISFF